MSTRDHPLEVTQETLEAFKKVYPILAEIGVPEVMIELGYWKIID